MASFLSRMAAVAVLVAALGCARTDRPTAASDKPCAQCTHGYVQVGKAMERRTFCVIDNRVVDCSKEPAECGECAKILEAK